MRAGNYFLGSGSIREASPPGSIREVQARDMTPEHSNFEVRARGSTRAARILDSTRKSWAGIHSHYFAGPNFRFSNCSNSAE